MNEQTFDDRVTIDVLKDQCNRIRKKLIKEGAIETEIPDITPLFFKGIRQKIIKKECLSLVIRGQTTKGKSTAGLLLKYIINNIINEIFPTETTYKGDQNEFELIGSNQIEFTRISRRQDLFQVCALVDEFSDMARAGSGATTEEKLLDWNMKVCAQKYIHKIWCTPRNDYDNYGILILDVIDTNKPQKITKLKVYYNEPHEQNQMIPIGVITLDVGEIIEKDWYKQYRKKKEFAMDLLLQNTIRDIRELEQALIKLITYQKCKELAGIGHNDTNYTRTKIKETGREFGAVYSIVGLDEITQETHSMLSLLIRRNSLEQSLTRNRQKPLTSQQKEEITKQIKAYENEIAREIKETTRLIQLYIEYMRIGDKYFENKVKDFCNKYNINIDGGETNAQ